MWLLKRDKVNSTGQKYKQKSLLKVTSWNGNLGLVNSALHNSVHLQAVTAFPTFLADLFLNQTRHFIFPKTGDFNLRIYISFIMKTNARYFKLNHRNFGASSFHGKIMVPNHSYKKMGKQLWACAVIFAAVSWKLGKITFDNQTGYCLFNSACLTSFLAARCRDY